MSRFSLRILSSHTLPEPIRVDQTVICSPHELVAIVTYRYDVVVYRLNGQAAFSIKNPQDDEDDEDESMDSKLRVEVVEWSPDGRNLAIAWSDGTWNIYEAEKGETVLQGTVRDENGDEDATVVTGMSWQRHATRSRSERVGWTWQHILDANDTNGAKAYGKADLPRAITLLDVTAVLPRLSALPSHGLRSGPESARFSNQSATDSIFASTTQDDDGTVEVLVVYLSSGKAQVLLNGKSVVGTVQGSIRGSCVKTASHADSPWHTCLTTSEIGTLEVLDLPLHELNGPILHLASHVTAQLAALTQYARRTTQCITHDYTTGTFVATRFTRSISMTLEENQTSRATLTSAFFQLTMTGQFHPDIQEWLLEIVREAGLKRWDASISGMYSAVQTHLHTHMLPALDRLTIAATRLRGLARLHQGAAAFTPDEKLFSSILVSVDELRAACFRAIDISVGEWSLWRMFFRWMKMQIEIAGAGPDTKEAGETEERESLGLDITQVLQYVNSVLDKGSELGTFASGGLDKLVAAIEVATAAATDAIAHWQGRLFSSMQTLDLPLEHHRDGVSLLDVSLDPSPEPSSQALHLAVLIRSEDAVHTTLNTFSIPQTEPSKPEGSSISGLQILRSSEYLNKLDAKIYHGGTKMLCLEDGGESAEDDGKILTAINTVSNEVFVMHHFPTEAAFSPERIFVGGRKGMEFCVAVSKGSRSWQILDLHAVDTAKEVPP